MIKTFLTCLTASALAALLFSAAAAQTRPPAPLPFAAGEQLNYEAKLNKSLLRGLEIADLSFKVSQTSPSQDIIVNATARSKGTLTRLFRFSFLQEIASTFDEGVDRVSHSTKRDVQKERVRESRSVFDYGTRQVIYTEIDPNDAMRAPRRIASTIPDQTHDLISAIYKLRTLPLAVGKKFKITVSDSGLVYEIPVAVAAREIQKTAIGRVNCFRIVPEVFGTGRIIESEGSLTIWITDDARRIPVRARVNSNVGRIEIRISSAKNVKGHVSK